jgi:predicted DNA binding protein
MRYCELHLTQPEWMEHPMQEFLREGDAVEFEELLAYNPMRGHDVDYALFYVAGAIDPYRAAIDDVETVRRYALTPVDDGAFYSFVCQETREADVAFREAFEELELVVLFPVVYEADGSVRLTLVGEQQNFRLLLEGLPEDMDAEVRALGEYDRRGGRLAGALTDRQHEAVRVAVELGYYETPAEADLEDVGAALDCAPSTASNLLSKAEAAVMGRLAGSSRADATTSSG